MVPLRLLPAWALAAWLVGAFVLAGLAAAEPSKAPKITFSAQVRVINATTGKVAVSGVLRVNGAPHTKALSYLATESDANKAVCGSQRGRGSVFTMLYPDANHLTVTVKASAKVGGKPVKRSATLRRPLSGKARLNCNLRTASDVPPPLAPDGTGKECAYSFTGTADVCGVPMDANSNPLPPSAKVPYWDGQPTVNRNADGTLSISAPGFASPWGVCRLVPVGDASQDKAWLVGPAVHGYEWHCPTNVYIVPFWYFYFAPGDRADKSFHDYTSCQAGSFYLQGPLPANYGLIPAGGSGVEYWLPGNISGRVDVVLKMLVYRGNHSDSDVFISKEFLDYSFYPAPNGDGAVDPCPLIEAWDRPPGH